MYTATKTMGVTMHNLMVVFKFESIRTLKKKSFLITALLFPIMMAAIFGIVVASNNATEDAAKKMQDATFSIQVTDESQLIDQRTLAALKAIKPSSKQAGIDAVKSGQVDAYFYYPADVTKDKIEIYGKDVGMFDNGKYDSVAKAILTQSASSQISPNLTAILGNKTLSQVTTYRDGTPYDGFKEAIVPGLFLVLFYFLIAMFGNQMLTSTTEEKENRVIEMILTTVQAKTLIIGKVLSLITLAIVQAIIFLAPVIIGYLLLHNQLSLPSLDLTSLPFNPLRIASAFAIFAASFLLFTGLLVAVGAASPSAKEAGSYFGILMILLFGPLYAVTLFVSSPESPLVRFLTFFPFTAPIPALLRNAVGNMSGTDTAVVIAILIATATVVMTAAVQLFKKGAIEYDRNLLPSLIRKK